MDSNLIFNSLPFDVSNYIFFLSHKSQWKFVLNELKYKFNDLKFSIYKLNNFGLNVYYNNKKFKNINPRDYMIIFEEVSFNHNGKFFIMQSLSDFSKFDYYHESHIQILD